MVAKSVLVVDDSNSIRQSLGLVLEQAGYAVTPAADGVDAMSKVNSTKFDLVITDVNMPNMDGITLTKQIRASSSNRFTPILILTTESQEGKIDEGKVAGATGWIVKPFDPEKLLATVRKVLP